MSALTTNIKRGDTWVYAPVPCYTGALYAQPQEPDVRLEACWSHTPDYLISCDDRGALDAPECLPAGSVRAMDFQEGCRLLIGHAHREGRWL